MNESYQSFNLWDVLLVLARRKKFIAGFVLISFVIALAVAFLLPEWYRAKTSILPSQYDQTLGISGNFAQYARSSAGFELPLLATPSDVFATMLKSHTVSRAVIESNDLMVYYKSKTMQDCQDYLKDNVDISVTDEGVVELFYQDKNPEMSALIANSYIKQLDKLNRQVKVAKAKSDHEFIFQRLKATGASLDSARIRLLNFRTTNKTVDLTQQKNMAISTAREIKTQLALRQVALDVKRNLYSADHPSIRDLAKEIVELKKQLMFIEEGSDEEDSYTGLALARMPDLEAQLAALASDISTQEKVYTLLAELYEEARIKEQKDTPTISILETAYPPDLKYRPRRAMILVLAFVSSLGLALFISLFADYLERLRMTSPADYELINRTRDEIRGKRDFSDS